MKKFLLFIFVLALFAGCGVLVNYAHDYLVAKDSPKFTLIPPQNIESTSTDGMSIASSSIQFVTPTVDTSSWKSYANNELGFSLKYPSDIIMNDGGQSLLLAFPKETYFHWPLQDDVKITVVASTTCAGSVKSINFGDISTSTITIALQTFNVTAGTDIGAGNIYKEIIYDIPGNSICYSLILNSHGANGSGLYVNDPALIKKYDDQHTAENASLMDSVYGILGNFKVISTPAGNLER